MKTYDASPALDAKALLGEGPLWDERTKRLYWVDIDGYALHTFDTVCGADSTIDVGEHIGCLGLRTDGTLIAGLTRRIAVIDADARTVKTLIERSELPESRFNDGKVGPDGRFWAGTMSLMKKRGEEKLYTLDRDGRLIARESGITTSNGLDWSVDGRTMYYIDTPTMCVVAYDFDNAHGISNKRTVITFSADEGRPDGMCADADDMLWIAHWGGHRVTRRDPRNGALLAQVNVPASFVTSCCFGGDDLTDLYITTARKPVSEDALTKEPHAGGVFVVHVDDTRGETTYRFG